MSRDAYLYDEWVILFHGEPRKSEKSLSMRGSLEGKSASIGHLCTLYCLLDMRK